MAYTPFHADWEDFPGTSTPVTAAALEYIEDGIVDAAATADAATASAAAAIAKALVDAKGDLIVATAADTVARKAVGATDGMTLRVKSANSDGLEYALPPGHEFDVASVTAAVTVAATAEASQTTIVAGNSVTYDGATAVVIEFSCDRVVVETGATKVVVINLYEDSTNLCRIAVLINNGEGTGNLIIPAYGRLRRTPSAGAHTYTVKAHSTGGTATIGAGSGSGGAGTDAPILLRVVKAA